MNALSRLALLALPLAGLGWVWYDTAQRCAQGTEWDVPVGGYDPRDLLKGHYIQYSYQWPANPPSTKSEELSPADMIAGPASSLCLQGRAPTISNTIRLTGAAPKNCAGIVHDAPATDLTGRATSIPRAGRFYVSEAEAARLQSALSDTRQQAILHFRLRPDGVIVPLGVRFTAKP